MRIYEPLIFLRGRWEWVAFIQDRDSAILQTWWIVCVSDKTACVQGLFTNVSRALRDILMKFVYCRKRSSYETSKLKLCTCAQSMALGTRTKLQLEILTINVIFSIVYFREIILESSRNVNETTQNLEHRRFMFGTNRSPRKCVVAVKSYLNDFNYKLCDIRDPFYLHGLTLIPARISKHMPDKVWDEITYLFPSFNGATIEVL